MMQAAAEDKNVPEVTANPIPNIKLRRHPRKRRDALTPAEYQKLRLEIPEHYHLLLDFIIDTGLRWEETMGLRREDVRGNVVWIGAVMKEIKAPDEGQERFEYTPRTKTGKERQVKPRPELAERIAQCPEGFLFTKPDGSHIRGDHWRKFIWQPALRAIGKENSGLVPRDMRRTHATWLLEAGVAIEKISKRLGHSSIITTQLYLAIAPDSEDDILDAMNW